MTQTDIHQESHGIVEPQSPLLYGLNDKPPFKDALFVRLQHVCAIFIPVCTPGLLITLTLEVLADITATSMVSGELIEGTVYIRRLKGGILGDGVNSLIASMLGSFPIATPAQNNGIIQLTGVGSRYVGYYIAAILVFLGLFPLVGGVLLAIPTPVFGGAVMLMFGTVAVAGFNILRTVKMDNRAFVILAVSLAAGLGVTFLPEALEQFTPAVQSVLKSGIATSSICALVLNIVVPKPKEEAIALKQEPIAAKSPVPMEVEWLIF